MKLCYLDNVVYPTGRWFIEGPSLYYTMKIEVHYTTFFGLVKVKQWANADYIYEINECNSNG